jgi:hypothetical protein
VKARSSSRLDGATIAISAPNDWTYFRDNKICPAHRNRGRRLAEAGGSHDGDFERGWWSDGKPSTASMAIKSTNQVVAVSVDNGEVRR